MKVARFAVVSIVLLTALAVHYYPVITQEGGITFGLIQDITSIYGFYPWDTFSLRELKMGLFPLWNPHNALGEPHLANMQTALFYPLTWLKFAFGMKLSALDLVLLLRLYLAGLFTYLFARRLGLGVTASLVSALSFMLTGYFTRHIYMSHLNVEILIPAVMLTFGELARRGGAKWFTAAVATVWLTIVGGFPEATLYALALGALYYLWTAPRSRWPLMFAAIALGTLASAAQALPFIEYVSQAWFYHPQGMGAVHREIKYFFTLWTPWFFGANNVSPLAPFLTPYIGLAPLALAIAALKRKRGGGRWFFAGAAAVCFGLIYGIPPFSWLGLIPPLDITINYKYAAPPAAFCIAALAGMGAQELLDGLSGKKVANVLGVLIAIVIIAVVLNRIGVFAPYHHLRANDFGFIAHPVFSAALLALVVILVAAELKNFAAVLLVLVCALQPVGGNRPVYDDAVEKALNSPEAAYLKNHIGEGRFSAQDHIIFPDINLLSGFNDLRYYNPMYTQSYANLIMKGNRIDNDPELRQHFADHSMLAPEQNNVLDKWWRLANLQWWIGEGPPGSDDLMMDILVEADWRAERKGMIGGTGADPSGLRRTSILAHPPAEIALKIQVPYKGRLKFRPQIFPETCKDSDGVSFNVLVEDEERRKTVFSMFSPPDPKAKEYIVSLSEYYGKIINLVFITTGGSQDRLECDWSNWVSPTLESQRPQGWKQVLSVSDRLWERTEKSRWGWIERGCENAKVEVKRINSQSLDIKSQPCSQGELVIGNTSYPGWRAFSETGEVKIESSMGIFQSLDGGGNFRLAYEPAAFRIGLWVSIASFISLLFFVSYPIVLGRVGA